MKKLYNIIDSAAALPLIEKLQQHSNGYIGFRNVFFYEDMLVLKPENFYTKRAQLEHSAQCINRHIEASPETEFYIYYIETDRDINFDNGEKNGCYEYLISKLELPESNVLRLETNCFDDYRRNFLNTDHHWNAQGAYSAYLDICNATGTAPLPTTGIHCIEGRYLGTRAAGIEGIKKGSFTVNKFDYPEMSYTINYNPSNDYGMQSQFIAGELESFSYGSIYGPDCREIIFDTGKAGKNLLIMGDSYDNAILKALAAGFSKTYSIDLRAYDANEFDTESYITEHEIDTVIYIGGIDYFSSTVY